MKVLKWTLWVICLLIITGNVISYTMDVRNRASIGIEDWRYYDSPDGHYTLAYGYGYDHWVWLRLRRKGESEVLADRWFRTAEPPSLFWEDNSLNYREGDGGDGVKPFYLPPIWLEKWSAKLP